MMLADLDEAFIDQDTIEDVQEVAPSINSGGFEELKHEETKN